MRKDAEAGQSGSKSARNSVRDRQVEGCHPAVAEPDQEDRSQQDCQKQYDRCDDHWGGRCAGMGVMPAHPIVGCLPSQRQPFIFHLFIQAAIVHVANEGTCPELTTFENNS